jgi:hypothetical protein
MLAGKDAVAWQQEVLGQEVAVEGSRGTVAVVVEVSEVVDLEATLPSVVEEAEEAVVAKATFQVSYQQNQCY